MTTSECVLIYLRDNGPAPTGELENHLSDQHPQVNQANQREVMRLTLDTLITNHWIKLFTHTPPVTYWDISENGINYLTLMKL